MYSQPNHDETSTSSFFTLDCLNVPEDTITGKESREKDTCQAQSQGRGKETAVELLHDGAKKQERNAKERLRRLRLHASYLTLGTLLPDHHSSSSKKKWCAPTIIDRVITYIPKLQSEVEELTLRKKELLELGRRGPSIPAISVLELGGSSDEVVVQICMKTEKEDEFSNLLHVIEMQGLGILSASTSQVCQDQRVVYYNFHVKMDEKPREGYDYITVLKKNIISSLS